MKYFLHDSNSFNDEKITELFLNFGYEGLGLFYTLLEKFALQEKPIKTNVLKHQLKVGKKLEKCWLFMEEINLISSNNGDTFSEQLLNYAGKYAIKKEKTQKRVKEWRDNQTVEKNVTRYIEIGNAPKVKESKVKESKVNNIIENEFFFRIKDQIFKEKVSVYFQRENSIFLNQWLSKNKDPISLKVFDKMDLEYNSYDFNNHNHVQNTFKQTWQKILNGTNKKTPTRASGSGYSESL